jgi:hypothetical protein
LACGATTSACIDKVSIYLESGRSGAYIGDSLGGRAMTSCNRLSQTARRSNCRGPSICTLRTDSSTYIQFGINDTIISTKFYCLCGHFFQPSERCSHSSTPCNVNQTTWSQLDIWFRCIQGVVCGALEGQPGWYFNPLRITKIS